MLIPTTRCMRGAIEVGDDVTVTIRGVKGAQARVGLSAPAAVAVRREAVDDRRLAGRLDENAGKT